MFDGLPGVDALHEVDDATVIAAIEGWARAESAAAARRLVWIGELVRRNCEDDDDPRALWACDLWACTVAEVGAALNVSRGRASTQMNLAEALRTRLPKVAELFLAGALSPRLVSVIAWRTHLVDADSEAMRLIDTDIAGQASTFGSLSEARLEQAIDVAVQRHDPDAVVRFEVAARDRTVEFGKPDDETGTSSMWGRLYRTDAEVLDRLLTTMARSVCDADPRTVGQRRSDAMGAVAHRADRLVCQCGKPDCPNTTAQPAPPVIIHVVADREAVNAAAEKRRGPGGVLLSGGAIPTPLLGELIGNGAKLKPLLVACDDAEPRYRPSAALQEFVRCRDLMCRFPGCEVPAQSCDVDHTIPYPVGPTHPSNLKCLCRNHHLLKTFWGGTGGWTDVQHPDGTVVWTSPAGRTYPTQPGSRLFFPRWDVRTDPLPGSRIIAEGSPSRGLMMPTRRRTRRADRAQHIKAQRASNDTS